MMPSTLKSPAALKMPSTLKLMAQRRELLVHDSLAFLALTLICLVLYGVTWTLFRSFEAHRADLAARWAERGRTSLAQGKPADAIYALRTALSYAPDDRGDQLLLAQALANAGHTDEATNYFLNLWEQTPGDGFINLELARIARGRNENLQATNYYRAAIFGNWGEVGPARRREVRLELADFLVQQHDLTAAHAELFIAAANFPLDAKLQLQVARRLVATGDFNDALLYDQKAVALTPDDRTALAAAAEDAYALGSFPMARRLFERAAAATDASGQTVETAELTRKAQQSERAIELSLSRDLPQPERVAHLLIASNVAQARLNACIAQTQKPLVASGMPPAGAAQTASQTANAALPLLLTSLKARWAATTTVASRRLITQNADAQDARAQLINETEQDTARLCGAPTGDDAILLMLAGFAHPAPR